MLRWTARLIPMALLGATGAVVGVVVGGWILTDDSVLRADAWRDALLHERVMRTLGGACVVAFVALLLAWPVSRATARAGPMSAACCMLPILMPPYLVPGAWRTLLDPGSAPGAWLIRVSRERDLPLAQLIDHGLALIGLGIWSAPLAWVVLVVHWRGRTRGRADALRLMTPTRLARLRFDLRESAGAMLAGGTVAALAMLAQGVPFDLARIDTIASAVRVSISLQEHAQAAMRALPIMALAGVAGFLIARGVRLWRIPAGDPATSVHRGAALVAAIVMLTLGVLLPASLFTLSLHDLASIARFVRYARGAMLDTLAHAGVVGVLMALLAWSVSILMLDRPRLGAWITGGFCAVCLLPGTLIGASIAHAFHTWPPLRPWSETGGPLVLAHLARFGGAACLIGVWLRRGEPGELCDILRLGGLTFRRWICAELPRQWPGLLACVLLGAALSMHEVEAGVLLQPVGHDALARLLLELLHYQRREDLAAGVLVIVSPAALLGLVALVLLARRRPAGA